MGREVKEKEVKVGTLKEVLTKDLPKIFKDFGKRLKVEDSILEIPSQVKKTSNTLGYFDLVTDTIMMIFSFLLSGSNAAIEAKLALLGMILFFVYKLEPIVNEYVQSYSYENRVKKNLILENQLTFKGGQILSKTSGKVMIYDSKRNVYQVMDKEKIVNSVKRYLEDFWKARVDHKFIMMEIVSIIIMLITIVKTNNELPQGMFMCILIFFGGVSFVSATYGRKTTMKYFDEKNELKDKQDVIFNDLLRVPEIAGEEDTKMRLAILKETLEGSSENSIKSAKERNRNDIIKVFLQMVSEYVVIIVYFVEMRNNISLETIAKIMATLAIIERAFSYIGQISRSMGAYSELITKIEEEGHTIRKIMRIFRIEEEKLLNPPRIEDMIINPFRIGYMEESENDRPFTLISKTPLEIKKGSIVILTGVSGSGKSTFLKRISGRIQLESSDEIPSTSRFRGYDETLTFGSLSIFEELFNCSKAPDFEKMEEILRNLKLWEELSRNCHNVWQWMKEKKFSDSLSNGQKQRMILAKLLYFVNSDIDVCIFDEATSGLDDTELTEGAEASAILEYLVNYVNADRKRTVFISTHQNIDIFMRKMKEENYEVVILNFKRQGEFNLVERIE